MAFVSGGRKLIFQRQSALEIWSPGPESFYRIFIYFLWACFWIKVAVGTVRGLKINYRAFNSGKSRFDFGPTFYSFDSTTVLTF